MKKVIVMLVAVFALASCNNSDNIGDLLTSELKYTQFWTNKIDTAIFQIVDKNHDDKFDYILPNSKKGFKKEKGRINKTKNSVKLFTYEKENTYSKGILKKYLTKNISLKTFYYDGMSFMDWFIVIIRVYDKQSGKLLGYLAMKPKEKLEDYDYIFFPAIIKPERMLEEYGKYWYDLTTDFVNKKKDGWSIIRFFPYYNTYTGKLLLFCVEPDKNSIKNLTISNSTFKKELQISGFVTKIDMSKYPAGYLHLYYQHNDSVEKAYIYNVRDVIFRTKATQCIPQFEGDIINTHRDTDGDGMYDTWITRGTILLPDSTYENVYSKGKLESPYPIYNFEKK